MRILWLLPGEAARILDITRSGAAWLADTRKIRSTRTISGVRLLSARDVERLQEERQTKRRTATGRAKAPK